MTRLRRVLFIVFAAIYLIVAPLTVLYALGFIFSPAQQALLRTGLISLATQPEGAKVSLDGIAMKDKTPVVVRNLDPGMHEIRVSLEGRHPWQRTIELVPERVLRFEDVLLFPLSFEAEILSDFPISKIWGAPDGKFLLIQQGDSASGLSLWDTESGKSQRVFTRPSDSNTKITAVKVHPQGDRALVFLERQTAPQTFLLEFTDPAGVKDFSDFITEPLEDFAWSPDEKNTFFYLKGKTLKAVDLERRLVYPILVKRVQGFSAYNGKLFVLDRRQRFLEFSQKGKLRQVLLKDPAKARKIFGEEGDRSYSIVFLPSPSVFSPLSDSIVLFGSESGKIYTNKLPYFLDEGATDFLAADAHPRAAYRKGDEIWGVDFEREKDRAFFETGPLPRRIHRGDSPPRLLTWFYNDRYLLFLEEDRLKVQDFESDQEALELLRISDKIPAAHLDIKRGFFYFAEPGQGRLARVKLFVPPHFLPRLAEGFEEITGESS